MVLLDQCPCNPSYHFLSPDQISLFLTLSSSNPSSRGFLVLSPQADGIVLFKQSLYINIHIIINTYQQDDRYGGNTGETRNGHNALVLQPIRSLRDLGSADFSLILTRLNILTTRSKSNTYVE